MNFLCHYDLRMEPPTPALLSSGLDEAVGILELYGSMRLPAGNVWLYAPYEVELERYIRRERVLTYAEIIHMLSGLLRTLSILHAKKLYPSELSLEHLVIVRRELKLKLTDLAETPDEPRLMRCLGFLGYDIVNSMRGHQAIEGLTTARQTEFLAIMDELVSGECLLSSACLKLSALSIG